MHSCQRQVWPPDSRNVIGTDHEDISVHVIEEQVTQGRGPRQVCQKPDLAYRLSQPVTQATLEAWAKSCTKPKSKAKFQLSEQAQLGKQATQDRTAQAWKAYQNRVRDEHTKWQADLAAKAVLSGMPFDSIVKQGRVKTYGLRDLLEILPMIHIKRSSLTSKRPSMLPVKLPCSQMRKGASGVHKNFHTGGLGDGRKHCIDLGPLGARLTAAKRRGMRIRLWH